MHGNYSTSKTQNFVFSRIGFAIQKGLQRSLLPVYLPLYCNRLSNINEVITGH
ncbi:hypothetical protein Hanom_Chr15g01354581 [Helianthus anomalus]